eukprot:6726522-Pyramimonas_sp.AAC.1
MSRRSSWRVARESSTWSSSHESSSSFLPFPPSWRPQSWITPTLYWVRETHADCAAGTFGGAPYGATKR